MTENFVEFFTGKPIEIEEEEIIEEEINYDEMIKFFKESEGYQLVPISDPISEDLRILHRGIFPTSSYFEERDRMIAKLKKKKDKVHYDDKPKEQTVKETSLPKEIKTKKKSSLMDKIKKIFAPFPRIEEEQMIIVDSGKNKKNTKKILN